jgi:prepilin-type N-terminal cleavage/methylation domain-containing protein
MGQKNSKKAFTIVEILLALAVGAMLITAITIAFNAAALNYRDNQAIAESVNTSRQFLYKITEQLRTADINSISNNVCNFTASDGQELTYYYDANDSCIYLTQNSTDYTVCENVNSLSFQQYPTGADADDVEKVQVNISISQNGETRDFSA